MKFQRYDAWHWDHLFENIDANWTKIKTLMTQQCMLFPPNKTSYEADFYHALGSYYAVENGLCRGASFN